MAKLTNLFLFATIIVSSSASGEVPFWLKPTPGRTEGAACALVRSETELTAKLSQLKWDLKAFPNLDWGQNSAVVIAPSQTVKGWRFTFFGTASDADGFFVDWGWTRPDIANERSITYGASTEGPQVLVVSVPNNIDREIHCRKVR